MNLEKRKSPAINKEQLSSDDFKFFYSILNENITEYDCGILCNTHGAVSSCCTVENVIPLLYSQEFDFLQTQNSHWKEWDPKTTNEIRYSQHIPPDQKFCECKIENSCPREWRSISCRIFPMEPYIDSTDTFIGLTFIQEFAEKDPVTRKIRCPLISRPHDIRQKFIDSVFYFWEFMIAKRVEEFETYKLTSKTLRNEFYNTGKRFLVFFPTHLKSKYRDMESIYTN